MAEISEIQLEALNQQPALLNQLIRGIEKESLRVTSEGYLSTKPHPPGLGSALTHPNITTDFSEAQLELITDVHPSVEASVAQLENVHRFVYQNLDHELLWASSMPCMVGEDKDIPIGRYGSSNIGRVKSIYRLGLGNRYGRLMQTISGIHYNFSIPEALWPILAEANDQTPGQDFQTRAYFGLIRNFRRFSWLLIYLFGASPAVCKTFTKNLKHNLEDMGNGTLYLPHATSLRMGRMGYQSDAQASLHVSYNCLESYAQTIREALTTSYPAYEDIGIEADGEYGQLNSSLIQIENEFYGTIRPKRTIRSGERPLNSLLSRGVEYVEVRCLDLNPFLRVGIDACQMRFLDTFLLYCLLAPSPADSKEESAQMITNQLHVVEQGRKPGLVLNKNSHTVSLTEWADTILIQCKRIALIIDAAEGNDCHKYSVDLQAKKVTHPEHTPSARIIETMQTQNIPFYRFAMNQSLAHKGYFDEHPLTEEVSAQFKDESERSIERQSAMELAQTEDFAEFLVNYLKL